MILQLGLVSCTLLPLAAAGGCGRIGYDPLPESALSTDGAPGPRDATARAEGGGLDATREATPEASDDVSLEGAPDVEDAPEEVTDSDTDAACTADAPVDYCQVIPPLPAPPLIDGVLDCGPTLVPIAPEDWRGAAPLPPFPSGNTAELAAAWRPDGLYVFIAVTTPVAIPADLASPVYYGAGVELFVDADGVFATPGQYDNPGTDQMIVTSPPYTPSDASAGVCADATADATDESTSDGSDDAPPDATDAQVEASAEASGPATGQRAEIYRNEGIIGPWASSQFGTFPTSTGFVFEGFVVAADLGIPSWALAAGAQIGFDVAVDVSFPDECTVGFEGHRAGQYFLHVGMTPTDAPAEAAADADDAGDADATNATPIGAPYEDSRSFCTPTLTAM